MGYDCKLAYCVSSKGDTTIAWYTNQIPAGYGFFDINNLPGAALELVLQKMQRHIVAYKIEKTGLDLFFPENAVIK